MIFSVPRAICLSVCLPVLGTECQLSAPPKILFTGSQVLLREINTD